MRLFKADTEEVLACNALIEMQVRILPYDVPCDVTTGHWWFAYVGTGADEELAGFAGIQYGHQGNPAVGHLVRSGVFEKFTGKGIQKKLIRKRLAHAQTLGYITSVVTDTYNNPASANSLIACGFRTYMPEVPWCGDGAIYWRKLIK